jgi:(1->4)-alpha-D-glucan 1-alpha-D-glucosylmutase
MPDIYQGSELWDLSLVDPDNRRPPDWPLRRELLSIAIDAAPAGLAARWQSGGEKLFVSHRLLQLRREFPAVFAKGEYLPLTGEDDDGDGHFLAFARQHEQTILIVAVPRLIWGLYGGSDAPQWGDAALPLPRDGRWRDALTGRCHEGARILAADLFAGFPIAVLVGDFG